MTELEQFLGKEGSRWFAEAVVQAVPDNLLLAAAILMGVVLVFVGFCVLIS